MSDDKLQRHSAHSESSETLEKTSFGDDQLQEVHSQLLREKEEPSEGFAPVPMFLIFFFAGMMFISAIYLATFAGGFDGLVYDEHKTSLFDEDQLSAPAVPISLAERGERLYRRNCVQCHQLTGLGVAGAFPPLVGSDWVTGSEERLVKILLHGLNGELTIQGQTYNGIMPPAPVNSDRDIAALASYVRSAWGNEAPEVTEETVTAVRDEFGSRSSWTVQELIDIYGDPEA